MFTLVRAVPLRRLAFEHVPTLGLSLAIAEVAFKFHSFLLEASAFLVTWYALDALRHWAFDSRRAVTGVSSGRES